jgi:hypothetical protein
MILIIEHHLLIARHYSLQSKSSTIYLININDGKYTIEISILYGK